MSRVTAIILLWLSASSSAGYGAVNATVITPLPTKPSATKCRNCAGERGNYWHEEMRQRDVAAPDAKYSQIAEYVALKMMLCVMMLPLVVVGCTSKQSVSQCVKPPPPPAWIMQPLDWQTPLNGIISPSERGWSLCKNNWRNPEVY